MKGFSNLRKGFQESAQAVPIENPRVTEAVIAAVKTMNAMDKSPTGIMADDPAKDEILAIDKLVYATNKDFLRTKERIDAARIVRFGLFLDDWMSFKEEMKTADKIEGLSAKRLAQYRQDAISWANEASSVIRDEQASLRARNEFSLKTFLIATGVVIACILGAFILWGPDEETEEGDDLDQYRPNPYATRAIASTDAAMEQAAIEYDEKQPKNYQIETHD
jgi:hypothetical protein